MHTKKTDKSEKTRGQELGENLEMPPLSSGQHLMDMARDVGLYQATWQEINAWAQATGTDLSPFEASAIKGISATYSGAIAEFNGKSVQSPYMPQKMAESSIRSGLRRRGKS